MLFLVSAAKQKNVYWIQICSCTVFENILRTQNSFNFKSSGFIWYVHWKPELFQSSAFHWNNIRTSNIEGILFIITQNSFNFKVLELFQWKAEFWETLGFQCLHQIKPEVLLFIEIIPELLKLKEFLVLRKGVKSSGFFILLSSGTISTRQV